MTTEIITETKSPLNSTINWAQIAGLVASLATYFGVTIPQENVLGVILGIQGAVALYTVIRHTFFSTKVLTPAAEDLPRALQ